MSLTPPLAPKKSKRLTDHGRSRDDPWFWLRNKDDPAVMDYLAAENAYTDHVMKSTEELQKTLYREMRTRIKEDDVSVPQKEGDYFYYYRYEKGDQYHIECRRHRSLDNAEEILLNVNELAEEQPFLELGVCENSPNHQYLAYSVDLDGSEEYTIHVKDLHNDHLLAERIARTYDSLEWANDNQTFFYTVLDQHQRPRQVYRHRIGSNAKQDELVYEENDTRFFVSLTKSESGHFIYVACEGNNMSEWHYLNANLPDQALQLIEPRQKDHEYDVSDHGQRFFIRTNIDGAKDFKIVQTPISSPTSSSWQDFIAHEPGRLISDFLVFEEYLAVEETHSGLPQIRVLTLVNNESCYIDFDEEVYDAELVPGREFATNTLRFAYTSLATPSQVYDYDMASGQRRLRKEQQVLGDFRHQDYVSCRILAKTTDGAHVPISILRRKDTPVDGTAPLLLYGYGSYGHSIPASFSATRLSYVNRGFVYAIAHIRGGMELGYDWYERGKLMQKKNTFEDYIACAEALIQEKFTAKNNILAVGGSAGGMLMGAVANMRPDLFKAVIAHVPFVDVVNTMLDDTLPLTTMEYNEWGNPNNEEFFDYMLSYSPYDNVKNQDYPNILIVCGLNDPRVTYWEPAKWAAKLRAMKTDDNLLLLKVHMDSGHAGASGRFDFLKEVALDVAFAIKVFEKNQR